MFSLTNQTITCDPSLSNKKMTRNSQYYFVTINVQLCVERPTLPDLIKYEDKIREKFYRETKYEIKDKIEDQKYNFTCYLLSIK